MVRWSSRGVGRVLVMRVEATSSSRRETVKVLPEPVWPYAKSVAMPPFQAKGTRSAARSSYISSVVESEPKSLST
jgi:hypothetical protein